MRVTDKPADWGRRGAIGTIGAGLVATLVGGTRFGRATTPDIARFVDPELRAQLPQLEKFSSGQQGLSNASLAAARKGTSAWYRPPIALPRWRETAIERADGNALRLYVINEAAGAAKPAILHTHGGGFVMGEARLDIARLQDIARLLDCVIVTVDYRLAPETGWQGSTADNYAGLGWLHANAEVLGVDRTRIAVLGESAGGGHAALLAQMAHDRGTIALCQQVLIYPMLDDRTGSTRLPAFPIGSLSWSAADNRFGWESFLGQQPGTARVPPAAVPARRQSLAGLPPAFIAVGSIDLFVDEDVAYARRLIDAGVATELIVVPGAFHGFDLVAARTGIAQRFTATKLRALAAAFGQPAPDAAHAGPLR